MINPVLGDVPAPAKTNTLALSNRPKRWSELVGQPVPTTVLVNSIAVGDIKPGYVLGGITGCGKSSAAQLMAKRLNCENPDLATQDPCNECHSCRMIDAGKSADVKFIDGAAERSVQFVRETLKPFLLTAPVGKCRVAIIDEAHLYKADAISAFLTLLENLPKFAGKSVVIMTTTEVDAIDPAVRNRCMTLHFASIPNELLAQRMSEYTGEDIDALRLLAEEAGNSFRSMWAYIEVWQHMNEPLTQDTVMKLVGGISEHERQAMWADVASKRIDKVGDRWRKWLSQSGVRTSVVGALLIRDLVTWAASAPDSTDWHKPMLLLSGAQQVGSDSAWLQALYLMVGLPLDAHVRHRQGPAERQPQVADPVANKPLDPVGSDPVTERLLFFGA